MCGIITGTLRSFRPPTIKQKTLWVRHEDLSMRQDGTSPTPRWLRNTAQVQLDKQGSAMEDHGRDEGNTIAIP